MKRILPLTIILLVLGGFVGTLVFVWKQGQPEAEEVRTAEVSVGDVVRKTVATGAIVPRNEVAVKPAVGGVVTALHVEPGQSAKVGDLIAELRVIPDSERLASAQSAVEQAQIRLKDVERELERTRKLAQQGAVSSTNLELEETTRALRAKELEAARSSLQIIRTGASRKSGQVSTEVRAHIPGMVLTVPVKVGYSVVETNAFNEGTTIASIADMGDLVFEGFLDESEVGKVSEGMPLSLTVGAFPDQSLQGSLEYISPKGEQVNGAVQFAIRAALTPPEALFVRAGSSANADIVLEQAKGVLVVDEAALILEGEEAFVELQKGETWERRKVTLGLSDGISIEIKEGLAEGDVVKKQGG